jgi:hypothetical protein
MDLDYGFAMPRQTIRSVLDALNITVRPDGERYWHLHLTESEAGLGLLLPKRAETLPLTQFRVSL